MTDQLFDYLKIKNPDFQKINKRGKFLFTCPKNQTHKYDKVSPSMTTIPNSENFYCYSCGWKGNSYDIIRLVEGKQLSDDEVRRILYDGQEIKEYPELNLYEKYGWSLFAIAKNSKVPIKDEHWRELEFNSKDKSKWIQWIENGLNLAVNCEFSNVMIIDVDSKTVSEEFIKLKEEIIKLLEESNTLIQNTPTSGKHYVFNIDKELCFKQKVDLGGLKIDTRTEKGYFLVVPSKINNNTYSWKNLGNEIKDVPENIKSKLLELIEVDNGIKEKVSEKVIEISDNPIELQNNNLDGCCNDRFIQFGGVLKKLGIPIETTKSVLYYLNKNWLKNPMPSNAIEAMTGSIEGYKETEEQTQENSIYEACKLIQTDISAKDIMEHVFPGDKKKRAIVDKYLAKFHKEGKLSRRGRGIYDCKQKVEWTNETEIQAKELNYKIPYFDDIAHFRNGDIILIGAPTGKGKTTLAINFIKQMKEQGIIPYYLSLEAGSRHEKTAKSLGLTQKDYYIPKEQVLNPLQIEIESSSFTILDWLYTGDDFAQTQAIFKHLNDEMVRKGGILVVFTQLKENYDWFAVNLVKSFPRFACRFIYDDETGIISHFDICKITDPRGHYQNAIISCEFNFETKELTKKNNV